MSKQYKSPVLRSSFGATTGLPDELDLSDNVPPPPATDAGNDYRYQLFVNEANGFSHVVQVALALKGLQNVVYVNVVRHEDGEHQENVGCSNCDLSMTRIRIDSLARLMTRLFQNPTFPIPLLYDTHTHAVVSTETDVIVRFLDMNFNNLANFPVDLCPPEKEKRMARVEKKYLGKINESIGLAGLATNKDDFDAAALQVMSKRGLLGL